MPHEVESCRNVLVSDSLRHASILYVDDDPAARMIAARALSGAGCSVDLATDAAGAWTALGMKIYEAVVTDYQMPGITGLELIRRARASGIRTPVLLVSGALPPGLRVEGPALDPFATLAKPFGAEDLLQAIRNLPGLAMRSTPASPGGLPV